MKMSIWNSHRGLKILSILLICASWINLYMALNRLLGPGFLAWAAYCFSWVFKPPKRMSLSSYLIKPTLRCIFSFMWTILLLLALPPQLRSGFFNNYNKNLLSKMLASWAIFLALRCIILLTASSWCNTNIFMTSCCAPIWRIPKVSPPLCYLLRSCSSEMVLLSLLLMLQIIRVWSVLFNIYHLHRIFLSPLIGCASFSLRQPHHIGWLWSVFSAIYERPLLLAFILPCLGPHY
jgi:hypothetical protein